MIWKKGATLWGIAFLLVIVLGIALPVFAQFSVLSTIPADGATNVDTSITFEVKFNAPIDTVARFQFPPEFFLSLILYPDTLVGEPDSIVVSSDQMTVWIYNLHLQANTRYVFGIMGARSTTAESLDKPVVLTFSTGSTLPTGTISGTISYPGGDPAGTMVALFHNLFEENPAAMATVPAVGGDYSVNYVPGGTYWPVALKDVNKSGEFDPEAGIDVVAVYDPNGDGFADSLVVPEGGTLSGINLTLTSYNAMTARQRYPVVQGAAQNWSADAHVVMVGAPEISDLGESGSWVYLFYSSSRSEYFGIMAASGFIAPFPWQNEPPDTTALPENWLDSGVVADSAEAHGGSDFRTQHPDVSASAFLTSKPFSGSQSFNLTPQKASKSLFSLPLRSGFLPKSSLPQEGKPIFFLQKNLSFQNSRAIWLFQYFSESTGNSLQVFLDAVTGEFIELFKPTTARVNLDAANQAAQTWAADAELIFVGTHQSNLTPTGEAEMWFFVYHSASQNSGQLFFLSNGMILGQGPLDWQPPSQAALPANWLDSDAAINTAEAHGGDQYRTTNQNVSVSGGISRGLLQGQPDRAVWMFQYTSSTADSRTIFIDAVTGEFIQPAGPKATTAGVNLDAANQAAQTWASDAELILVGTHQSNLNPAGEAEMWFFIYHSASLDSEQAVFLSNGMVLGLGPTGWEPPSKVALPDNWIDSDVVIVTAETNGGSQYRTSNQNVWVSGGVSRGILPDQPDRAVWHFDYTCSTAAPLTVFVDAVSGQIVTGVDSRLQTSEIPQSYALSQNHPNPFNPETVIEYQLPRAAEVEISIFNLQGQKVATLVREYRAAGYHKSIWNGRDESGQPVASGVYLYRLEAGRYLAMKKMLVLR